MPDERESWRAVPGYAGFYEVSDAGNVYSLHRATARGGLLHPRPNSKGYRIVSLSKYGRTRTAIVSHLVLTAFRGPRPPGQQARHGPGGKLDDSLANLRWGTPSQNQLDRRRDGTSNRGERSATARLSDEIVLACRRRYAAGETQTALAAEFGVTSGAMCNAVRGRTWAHLTDGIPDPDVDGRSLISTPAMRDKRREYGRKGAEKRWHSP